MTAAPAASASAHWFGDPSHPLFGWYHPPQGVWRDCAVVLCAPFGHEYLVSYRAQVKLAQALAAAGFAVCHFDYDGCGDSADHDSPRVAAWQESIRQAMRDVRERSGARAVSLVGLRLGALLAASVACDEDLAALALIAPVLSGRAYARELLTLARMSAVPPSEHPQRRVTDEEVTGYALSLDTQAELAQLETSQMRLAGRPAVFIAQRDDLNGREEKLVKALQAQAIEVHLTPQPGYAAMMSTDAYNAVPPLALWCELVEWFCQRFQACDARAPREAAAFTTQTSWQHDGGLLVEEAVRFGRLQGVLSHNGAPAVPGRALILTNIGTGHRVGNHRLYVNLARRLAAQGIDVLRLDRGGVGYSAAVTVDQENLVYPEAGIDEVQAAMDFLGAHRGHASFALCGLCSGAYFSFHAAARDARASTLVMINPACFEWHPGDSLEIKVRDSLNSSAFYLREIWEPKTWVRLLRGDIAVRRIGSALVRRGLKAATYRITSTLLSLGLLREQAQGVTARFVQLARRHVDLLFVCDGNDAAIDVIREALGPYARLMARHTRMRMELIDGADHTFTPLWSQRHLFELLSRHLSQRLPQRAEPGETERSAL